MITRLLKKLPCLLWFLPGFLLWASFPPMGERMDVFFALAPLLWYARNRSARQSFLVFFANGFFFWFATLSWMPAIVKNGGPLPLVLLGWGALAVYCALYFGAFGFLSARLWAWVKPRAYGWRLFALFVAEPVLWAGLEIVRSRFGGGFAWNQLGVAAVNAGFGAPAAWGGVFLVSVVVVWVNGTFASIAERMFLPPVARVPKAVRSLETFIPLIFIFVLYAAVKPVAPKAETFVTFGLMQRNFPPVFKGAEDPRPAYRAMIGELVRTRPDVLVLPESAFSEVGALDSSSAASFVSSWLFETLRPAAVLAGGSRKDEDGQLFNSAALFTQAGTNGVARQFYDKVHLVPFGEFIPLDKTFTSLQRFAPVGSCTAGEPKVLSLDVEDGAPLRLGPAICYEDTDAALCRKLVRLGADVLVFITNDNWFAGSVEPEQHAGQALARAIETGRPVVRVGNSGFTGYISPTGEAAWLVDAEGRLLLEKTGTMAVSVPLPSAPRDTLYLILGDAPLFSLFLLLIMAMGVIKYYHDYEKRRSLPLQFR